MIPYSTRIQWEGRTFSVSRWTVSAPCIRKEAISFPPPSLPLFLARFPLLRAHIFHPGICHLSGWSICDLATGQVLSVGEFIRHMPVTPLSRIHFQINRPSPWAPSKREFLSRCAKLSPPQNIPISIITKRDSSKWMRPFPFLNSENLFSLVRRWKTDKKDKERSLSICCSKGVFVLLLYCNFDQISREGMEKRRRFGRSPKAK